MNTIENITKEELLVLFKKYMDHVEDMEGTKFLYGNSLSNKYFTEEEKNILFKIDTLLTMNNHGKELERIANNILENSDVKPNFTNRCFMNTLIIFQNALMDKMWDNQEFDKMPLSDSLNMVEACGNELHKLIHTYTGLDTHKIDDFL